MTTFEYFKAKFDKDYDYLDKCVRPNVERGSFHFLEVVANAGAFGGTVDVDAYFNIIGVSDTQEMRAAGFVRAWDDSRNGRSRRHVGLTKKGLRAFYKDQF